MKGYVGDVVRNCITNMPEDVKQKVISHANSNKAALEDELFAFISIIFGSGKQGKLKPRWEENFAW